MMFDMTNIDTVKALKSDLHAVFDTESGKQVMRYLEVACSWYQSVYDPVDRDRSLMNDGKRQVISTIKTLLELAPEQIVQMVRQKEGR